MSVFAKKLTQVPILLSFEFIWVYSVHLSLLCWYLCLLLVSRKHVCRNRYAFSLRVTPVATMDVVKYRCGRSSSFWKIPVWPDVAFTSKLLYSLALCVIWSFFCQVHYSSAFSSKDIKSKYFQSWSWSCPFFILKIFVYHLLCVTHWKDQNEQGVVPALKELVWCLII